MNDEQRDFLINLSCPPPVPNIVPTPLPSGTRINIVGSSGMGETISPDAMINLEGQTVDFWHVGFGMGKGRIERLRPMGGGMYSADIVVMNDKSCVVTLDKDSYKIDAN